MSDRKRITHIFRLMMIYHENRPQSISQIPHYRSRSTALVQNHDPLDIVFLYQLLNRFYFARGVYVGSLG